MWSKTPCCAASGKQQQNMLLIRVRRRLFPPSALVLNLSVSENQTKVPPCSKVPPQAKTQPTTPPLFLPLATTGTGSLLLTMCRLREASSSTPSSLSMASATARFPVGPAPTVQRRVAPFGAIPLPIRSRQASRARAPPMEWPAIKKSGAESPQSTTISRTRSSMHTATDSYWWKKPEWNVIARRVFSATIPLYRLSAALRSFSSSSNAVRHAFKSVLTSARDEVPRIATTMWCLPSGSA
mmetsp:Transcript_4474/g.11095  ORF Transcript_4474/g.11095 Transcript_4474/m.11095 type:complete len:240 (+) Transcript_4474:100-819(+)